MFSQGHEGGDSKHDFGLRAERSGALLRPIIVSMSAGYCRNRVILRHLTAKEDGTDL